MRLRHFSVLFLLLPLVASAVVLQGYRSWYRSNASSSNEQYAGEQDDPAPMPPDANAKTEWAFARLRYPSISYGWRRRASWGTDYPKADRQFVQGVRRLTRLSTRSNEQVINLDLDNDEIYNWPWVYAVEVGHWDLTDAQAKKIRDYLLRGGFLMVDDFHGTQEWAVFMASMSRIFPDRPIVDIPDNDPIFHVIYDVGQRFQIPGLQYLYSGRTYERDGYEAEWKAIYDDQHRVMVAICHNMDLGDAWEWADMPQYPEKYTTMAYRIGINYIVYAMTH
jgi:hypothetical protein